MDGLGAAIITEQRPFAEIQPAWDALVLASPRPTPFLLHGWLSAWWTHGSPASAMRCITVRDGDRLVGALPVAVSNRGPVRIGALAGGLHGGDAIIAGADRRAVVAELAAALRSERLDLVDFEGLSRTSALSTCLPGRVRRLGSVVAPSLELQGGWEATYQRVVGSASRKSQRRRLNRLERAGELAFLCHRDEAGVGTALEDAFRLHGLRWHDRHDTSAFGRPAGQAHHRAALRTLARAGYVRLLEMRLDDVPIGFQLYLMMAGTMFTYRVGFDPAHAQYSPGILTMLEAIRRAADEGATRVELLSGDEPYKLAIADHSDELIRLLALPARVRGRAYMEVATLRASTASSARPQQWLRGAGRRVRAAGGHAEGHDGAGVG